MRDVLGACAALEAFDHLLHVLRPLARRNQDGVIGLDHETHEVPGLYIVDGSSIPGPPAVNPQITIMAFADRAAGLIDAKLAAS